MSKLGDIKGIKPTHKAKLKKANVYSIQALRKRAATFKGRVELQSETGLSQDLIKDLANRQPGLIDFKVTGRRGTYAVDPAHLPLNGFVVLDPPTALSSGAPVDVQNGGRAEPRPAGR